MHFLNFLLICFLACGVRVWLAVFFLSARLCFFLHFLRAAARWPVGPDGAVYVLTDSGGSAVTANTPATSKLLKLTPK